LLRLYSEQIVDINRQLDEQLKYINQLKSEQQKLNLNTEQGRATYNYYNEAIAKAEEKHKELAVQLWNTKKAQDELTLSLTASQRQIEETFNSIEKNYKRGLMSLENYLLSLESLLSASTLPAELRGKIEEAYGEE